MHNIPYYAKMSPCKNCRCMLATEKLDEGYCDPCQKAIRKEGFIVTFLMVIFVIAATLLALSGNDEEAEHSGAQIFRPITSYHDYQQFAEANK
jgi:hypothetical protein